MVAIGSKTDTQAGLAVEPKPEPKPEPEATHQDTSNLIANDSKIQTYRRQIQEVINRAHVFTYAETVLESGLATNSALVDAVRMSPELQAMIRRCRVLIYTNKLLHFFKIGLSHNRYTDLLNEEVEIVFTQAHQHGLFFGTDGLLVNFLVTLDDQPHLTDAKKSQYVDVFFKYVDEYISRHREA